MTTHPTPKASQDRTAARRDLVRRAGELRRARRRTVARSLAPEFAASEADFERWIHPADTTDESDR